MTLMTENLHRHLSLLLELQVGERILCALMEREELDEGMLTASLNQPQAPTVQAEETSSVQDCLRQTTEDCKRTAKQRAFLSHAVIGARPYCSPEYSPDFHKLGSTLPCSTYRTTSHIKAVTFIPLQPSVQTQISYADKKRLLDKQEEIQEVKQLDDWKPAVSVFTAVLEGSDDKAN